MLKIVKTILHISPVWFQNFIVSAYGLLREFQRYGGNFKKYVAWLGESEKQTYEQIIDNQIKQLRFFLKHAYENVPYYTSLFDSIIFKPEQVKSISDINKIPLLTKETIRTKTNELFAKNISKSDCFKFSTSGTTGKSLTVYISKDDFRKRMAFLERQKIWAGINSKTRVATFTGRTFGVKTNSKVFWRRNIFGNQLYFSSYHLSEQNLKFYASALNKFKPNVIEGYPSAISTIAKWINDNSFNLDFQPKAILSTGETLQDYQKHLIEKCLKAKVYNYYASSEGAPFITQCRFGTLHVNPESGLFEILDEANKPISESGVLGNLVVTSFLTHATPLIRYQINDKVLTDFSECKCGLPYTTVGQIVGRTDDILYTRDRGYIGRLSPAIKAFPNSVKDVQFIQKSLDLIEMYIVPDTALFKQEHIELALKEVYKRTGTNIKVQPIIVDTIPRANKFRLAIREFDIE